MCIFMANIIIMNNKVISVQKHFHQLFGRQTTLFDILIIVGCSIAFASLSLGWIWNTDLSVLKKIIHTILALDIGGGVVANFTEGTNNYYAESLNRKYFFIFFHLLQPFLLVWIYPADLYAVAAVSLFTLIASMIILHVKTHHRQRVIALSLLTLCMMLTILIDFSGALVFLTMLFYAIKLILAFSVNWISDSSNKIDSLN